METENTRAPPSAWLIYNRARRGEQEQERVTTTLDAWWQQQGNNDNDDDCNGADNAVARPEPDPEPTLHRGSTRLKVEHWKPAPETECERREGENF